MAYDLALIEITKNSLISTSATFMHAASQKNNGSNNKSILSLSKNSFFNKN